MTLLARFVLYYLGVGCFVLGFHSHLWWAESEAKIEEVENQRQYKLPVALRLLVLAIGVALDLPRWPSLVWSLRRKARERQHLAQVELEFEAARQRMRECPHTQRTLVDVLSVVPTPMPRHVSVAPTPMPRHVVKCRQCWALQIEGEWHPNSTPPPPPPSGETK